MTARYKGLVVAIIAAILVVTGVVGSPWIVRSTPIVVLALAGVGVLVLFLFKIRANRRTRVIFGFYVDANEILVDGERSRYHFEIAQVISTGEKIVRSMRDAPPLTRFALGALYYSIGDYNAATEQLSFAAEEELQKESQHLKPSRQLRRYVAKLRKIERRPKRWSKTNAAIASLERLHQERGARLLAQSQQHLKRIVEAHQDDLSIKGQPTHPGFVISPARSLKSINAPPPISEVLQDVYQEEPKAS